MTWKPEKGVSLLGHYGKELGEVSWINQMG